MVHTIQSLVREYEDKHMLFSYDAYRALESRHHGLDNNTAANYIAHKEDIVAIEIMAYAHVEGYAMLKKELKKDSDKSKKACIKSVVKDLITMYVCDKEVLVDEKANYPEIEYAAKEVVKRYMEFEFLERMEDDV